MYRATVFARCIKFSRTASKNGCKMQLNGRSQEPWLFLCVVSLSVSAVTWGEVSYSSWDFTCLNLPRRNDSELSWDLKQMSSVACLICRSSCTVKVTPTCSYLALWLTYTAFAQQHRQSRHSQIKICGRFKSHCDFGKGHLNIYMFTMATGNCCFCLDCKLNI